MVLFTALKNCAAVVKEKAFRKKKAACAVTMAQAAFLPSGDFPKWWIKADYKQKISRKWGEKPHFRLIFGRPHTNNPNTFRMGEAFGFFVSIE